MMITGMKNQLRRFLREDSGASAVEYVLLVVGIGVTIMATVNFFSDQIVNLQTEVTDAIQD